MLLRDKISHHTIMIEITFSILSTNLIITSTLFQAHLVMHIQDNMRTLQPMYMPSTNLIITSTSFQAHLGMHIQINMKNLNCILLSERERGGEERMMYKLSSGYPLLSFCGCLASLQFLHWLSKVVTLRGTNFSYCKKLSPISQMYLASCGYY